MRFWYYLFKKLSVFLFLYLNLIIYISLPQNDVETLDNLKVLEDLTVENNPVLAFTYITKCSHKQLASCDMERNCMWLESQTSTCEAGSGCTPRDGCSFCAEAEVFDDVDQVPHPMCHTDNGDLADFRSFVVIGKRGNQWASWHTEVLCLSLDRPFSFLRYELSRNSLRLRVAGINDYELMSAYEFDGDVNYKARHVDIDVSEDDEVTINHLALINLPVWGPVLDFTEDSSCPTGVRFSMRRKGDGEYPPEVFFCSLLFYCLIQDFFLIQFIFYLLNINIAT